MSSPAASLPAYADPRSVLRRHGLAPKRSYSQNFLVARPIVEAIAEAATAHSGGAVVELGAGLGTLTLELMRRAPVVVAVERDPDMIAVLTEELVPHGLSLVAKDAAALDYDSLRAEHGGERLRVAGNLPYAATGAILRSLYEQRGALASAVVMLQREVRDRLAAAPGSAEYGALTVFCRLGFEFEALRNVRPSAFVPPPKVQSSVIRLTPREAPLVHDSPTFSALVRAAFQRRRKTLRNALASIAGAAVAERALADAAIDGQRRGETLDVDEFGRLAQAWPTPIAAEERDADSEREGRKPAQ